MVKTTKGKKKNVDSEKSSKELEDIMTSIRKYLEKNKDEIYFIGHICRYKKDGTIVEGKTFAYGDKELLKIDLDGMKSMMDEEEEFINW